MAIDSGFATPAPDSEMRTFRSHFESTRHIGVGEFSTIGGREDTRRWANGDICHDIGMTCAKTRTSRDWCGYWQGNKG